MSASKFLGHQISHLLQRLHQDIDDVGLAKRDGRQLGCGEPRKFMHFAPPMVEMGDRNYQNSGGYGSLKAICKIIWRDGKVKR